MLENTSGLRRILREALVLGVLMIGVLAARSTLADHYFVPSGSMEHTLVAGDRVVVNKHAYGFRVPFSDVELTDGDPVRRGDVVIFDSPKDGKRLIKRIVATAGDRVRIQNGRLYINDRPMASVVIRDAEIIGGKVVQLNLEDGGGPALQQTIAPGMVLAIGDHRGNSIDGRYFGAIPEEQIYGRAVAIYYRRLSGVGWIKL